MIKTAEIIVDLDIKKLSDLKKVNFMEEALNIKVNRSALARELDVDRRTIEKYISGYEKPQTRIKESMLDDYYDIIKDLLSNPIKIFAYKSVLYHI